MPNNKIQSLTVEGVTYDIVDNTSGYITADSPALTGTPTAPTPLSGAGDTQIATVKYVQDAMAGAGAGTVTSVGIANATDGGLSVSGSPITGSGTISVGHSNVLASAQTMSGIYPIKIDKNGHISEYGSAVSIPSNTSDLNNDSQFVSQIDLVENLVSTLYYLNVSGSTASLIDANASVVGIFALSLAFRSIKGVQVAQLLNISGNLAETRMYEIVDADTINSTVRLVAVEGSTVYIADLTDAGSGLTGTISTTTMLTSETDPVFSASAAAGITSTDISNWNGKTSNTGTVTKVTAGTGLSIGSTAGGNFTTSGTINHTNSVTAQTTQALYPIKIDAQGHISDYGSAVSVPTKTSDLTNDSGFITGMTILSYGTSTWNDFLTAYNANKVVYCRASSNSNPASGSQTRLAFMAYVNNATTPTSVEFQYYRSVNTHTESQQGDQVYVYTLTSAGSWSVTAREASVKVVAGTGLSGTYSNGTMTLTGPTISLNGSSTTSASFYAPTDAGTSGYVLTSSGSGAPTWAEVSTSDTKVTQTVISDSSSNKKGLLLSNGDGSSTLTSTSYTSATLQYQPSTRTLSLREYGDSLTPGANLFLSYDTITFAGENFNTDLKQALNPNSHRTIYLPDADGTLALTSDISTVPTISLNGTSTTSPSFYAPTSAGTSGYVLTSNGSGAPTWAAATGGSSTQIIRWTES